MVVSRKNRSMKKHSKTQKRSTKNKTMRKRKTVMKGSGTVPGMTPWAIGRANKNSKAVAATQNNKHEIIITKKESNLNNELTRIRAKYMSNELLNNPKFMEDYTPDLERVKENDNTLILENELEKAKAEKKAAIEAEKKAHENKQAAIKANEKAVEERKKAIEAEKKAHENKQAAIEAEKKAEREKAESAEKLQALILTGIEAENIEAERKKQIYKEMKKTQQQENNNKQEAQKVKDNIAYQNKLKLQKERRIDSERQNAYERAKRAGFPIISRSNINSARNSEVPISTYVEQKPSKPKPSKPKSWKKRKRFLGVDYPEEEYKDVESNNYN